MTNTPLSLFPPVSIGSVTINPGLVLAPMSGVTTSALRRLIKELNPGAVGLVVTEFISVEALTRKVPRSIAMMQHIPSEHPLAVQIFGFDIARMVDAALMAQDAGAAIVDINCGCPAPKVVRKGGGCELMRHPEHLQQLFQAVRKVLQVPLTMKMRSGWDQESRNCTLIAQMAEDEGLAAITIHGRTRAQLYRGDADWEIVRQVAAQRKIPVFGSGDVVCGLTAQEKLQIAPPLDALPPRVAGLYVGRGALEDPTVFTRIVQGLPRRKMIPNAEAIAILQRYIQLLLEEFPAQSCIGKVKQLASQMGRGHVWRKELLMAKTLQEQSDTLARHQTQELIPLAVSHELELSNAQ